MKTHARTFAVALVLLFTLAVPAPPPASAATLAVTDCGDSNAPGQLRTLIAAAAAADTITIPAICTVTLTQGIPLTIDQSLTITGAGASQTIIDGGSITQILEIGTGAVTISDVTLRRGRAGKGGAVQVLGGASLVSMRTLVTDNTGTDMGGGIMSDGALTLVNSTVAGNFGGFGGGGILANNGPLTLINSTVSGNRAGLGGGIASGAGAVTLTNSTISGNAAVDGQ